MTKLLGHMADHTPNPLHIARALLSPLAVCVGAELWELAVS